MMRVIVKVDALRWMPSERWTKSCVYAEIVGEAPCCLGRVSSRVGLRQQGSVCQYAVCSSLQQADSVQEAASSSSSSVSQPASSSQVVSAVAASRQA